MIFNKIVKYKTILLASAFCLLLILIPDQAHSFVFDLAKASLKGLAEWTGPFAGTFIFSFLFFVFGYLFLWMATSLLQGIIMITPTALTVTGEGAAAFVRAGWGLSAGIVNLLLIIAFIVIAFAVIMGSEKIQLKKALPKLIVVALLVNFTLLFVGAGIDMSNFLFNTIATQFMTAEGEGGNIFFNALSPLFELSLGRITATLVAFSTITYSLAVPYVSTLVHIGWIVTAPFVLIPSVLQFIFQGVIMWSLSLVFLIYFVVFLSRIFIIQVLAILAPLAFFCLIFDDTKKWWDKWLKALIEWLFVGVIFIFLMYIALAMAPLVWTLDVPFQDVIPDMISWFTGTGDLLSYLVLLVYFIVVIVIVKSFIPAAANAVISQARAAVKTVIPFAKAAGAGSQKYFFNRLRKDVKDEDKNNPKPPRSSRGWFRETEERMVRRALNLGGTTGDRQVTKLTEAEVKKLEEKFSNDFKSFAEWLKHSQPFKSNIEMAAILQYLSKGGEKGLSSLPSQKLDEYIRAVSQWGDSKTIAGVIAHMPKLADPNSEEAEKDPKRKKTAEDINIVMEDDIKKAIENIASREIKFENSSGNLVGIQELEDATARMAAVYDIAARKLKASDVKSISDETLKDEKYIRAIIRNGALPLLQAIGEEKGIETVIGIEKVIGNMKIKELKELEKNNPTLFNQMRKIPGGQAMFSGFYKKIEDADQI